MRIKQLVQQQGVDMMARLVRIVMSNHWHSRQTQVTKAVENLVPHKFILIAQALFIHDPVTID